MSLGFSLWRDNFSFPLSKIADTVQSGVSAVIEVGKRLSSYIYSWDLVANGDYAVMDERWVPRGTPFRVSFKVRSNSYLNAVFITGEQTNGNNNLIGALLNSFIVIYPDLNGNSTTLLLTHIPASKREYKVIVTYYHDRVEINVPGVGSEVSNVAPSISTFTNFKSIAENTPPNGASPWLGYISDLVIEELDGPEGNYNVLEGGMHWAELDAPIKLLDNNPFNFKVKWQRTDNPNQENSAFIGNASSPHHIRFYNSDSTDEVLRNRCNLNFGGSQANYNDYLVGIEVDSIHEFEIDYDGTTVDFIIDGESRFSRGYDTLATDFELLFNSESNNARSPRGLAYDVDLTVDFGDRPEEHGFLEFGSNNPDVISSFTHTPGDLGPFGRYDSFESNSNGTSYDTFSQSAGFSRELDFTAQDWDDFYNNGFTLQFNIEKLLFTDTFALFSNVFCNIFSLTFADDDSGTNSRTIGFGRGHDDALQLLGDFANFPSTLSYPVQTFNDTYEDFVRLDFSFNPTVGNGLIEVYANKFLIGYYELAALPSQINFIRVSGFGGQGGFHTINWTGLINNVQLSKNPIAQSSVQKRIGVLGDSFVLWGGYPSLHEPTNQPWLSGQSDPDSYQDALPSDLAPNFTTRQLSWFGNMHSDLADRGVSPMAVVDQGQGTSNDFRRIEFYGLGGAAASGGMPEMVSKAILNPGYDYQILHIGTNDAFLFWSFTGSDDPIQENVDQFITSYKLQVDRLIDEAQTKQIIAITPAPYTLEPRTFTWRDALEEAMQKEIHGYRGTIVVDPYNDWGGEDLSGDFLHPSIIGQKKISDAVMSAIPQLNNFKGVKRFFFDNLDGDGQRLVSSDPSTEGFGATWTADNVTFIPANKREYKMDEGPKGLGVFKDSGDGIDAPIINYNEDSWSK